MLKKTPQIVLVSSSLSRKKIFKSVGLNFLVKKPNINEEAHKKILRKKNHNIKKIIKKLSEIKCKDVANKNKNKIVIGCDTMIKIGNETLDKATNLKDAEKKLKKLSGRKHTIFTAVCVYKGGKKIWQHTEKTNVHIRKITKQEIKKYLQKNKEAALTSVGCYQAETMGPTIFEKIDGDFYNVLGFPIIPFLLFINKHRRAK